MVSSQNNKYWFLKYNKLAPVFFWGTVMILLQGCPCSVKPPPYLERVEYLPNHFRMVVPHSSSEYKILRISVYDFSPPHETHWEIVAQTPITAKNFEITIGRTPKGFKQLKPDSDHVFVPRSGEVYYVSLDLIPPWEGGSINTAWEVRPHLEP